MINPVLEVRGIRKAFGSNIVLDDVSLKVAKSEMVFILGPSGSGKSTFLRCCNRLEEPDAGEVILDGVSLTQKNVNLNKGLLRNLTCRPSVRFLGRLLEAVC